MGLTKWEPLNDLWTLQEKMNRLWDVERSAGNGHELYDWIPAVDIYEDQESIEVRAEIPGMDLKNIEIKLEGDRLVVRGEKEPESREGKRHQRVEAVYGRFARTFSLPATVDREKIRATYQQGVLKLVLPKREETKPRSISIESE